jgi:hypothetical protein
VWFELNGGGGKQNVGNTRAKFKSFIALYSTIPHTTLLLHNTDAVLLCGAEEGITPKALFASFLKNKTIFREMCA